MFLLPTKLTYIFIMILIISGLVSNITDLNFEAVKTLLAVSALFLLPWLWPLCSLVAGFYAPGCICPQRTQVVLVRYCCWQRACFVF